MLIQESRHFDRINVLPTLQKAPSQCGYRVGVCLDQVRKDRCESYLVFECGYGFSIIWQQSRQRVEVIIVDLRDVGIRDNYEWEVSKSLYSMCEPNREEGEGEVCGGKQGFR